MSWGYSQTGAQSAWNAKMAHSHDWQLMLTVDWELSWDFSRCLHMASQHSLGLLLNDYLVSESVPTVRISKAPVRGFQFLKKWNWGLEFSLLSPVPQSISQSSHQVTHLQAKQDRFQSLIRGQGSITEVYTAKKLSLRTFSDTIICLSGQKILQLMCMTGNIDISWYVFQNFSADWL